MVKALKKVNDDRVRAYIIWLPIYGGDFEGEAQRLSSSFRDKRVSYFLDPDNETAKQWQPVLKTPFLAWDVYMLYGPDMEWKDAPPQPTFWMHQLGLLAGAPRLDEEAFAAKLKAMVADLKTPSSPVQTSGMAKIELLYFPSCPAYKPALANLRAALREGGVTADIALVKVATEEQAAKIGFQGSPSIRVNGQDLDGRNEGYAYSCRIYEIDGKMTPIPTKEFIARKLMQLTTQRGS